MEQNYKDINDDNSKSSQSQNEKNKEIYNIEASLGLKSYETTIFRYFISLNRKNDIPNNIEYLFIFIETIQLFSLFYNSDYIPNLPDSLKFISKIFTLRNVVNPEIALIVVGVGIALIYIFFLIHFITTYGSGVNFSEKLIKLNFIIIRIFFSILFIPVLFSLLEFFNCSNNEEDTKSEYICYNQYHFIMVSISLAQLFLYILVSYINSYFSNTYIPLNSKFNSLYSNKILSTLKNAILIEILNIEIFQVFFKIQYISSIIMFMGFVYLLYIHYNYQCYYNKKLNNFYSAIWFSMALTSFVYIIFTVINIKLVYPVFMGISAVGIIIGWYLNNFFFNMYSNKIFFKIERKYNQQHVISRLKEEIEMDLPVNDNETNSIETIVTTKKIIKKEKVYKKSSDCAYVSKFILSNRSIEAFKLVNSLFKEGISQFERSHEIYLQYWFYLHGIQKFISINKRCYNTEEINEYFNQMNILSEKILRKCANLSNTLFQKFVVFNALFIYEIDKTYLTSSKNSSDKETSNFELVEVRNRSIQYHLAALNTLKNLMESLKNLETNEDIDISMRVNDSLIEILKNGETLFKKLVLNSNYSKESLELYILFLRNSMNRGDLAGQFYTILDENEMLEDKQNENMLNKDKYEKSEKMSSVNSDGEYKKIGVLKKNMLQKCQEPLYKLLRVMQLTTSLACVMGIICNIIYFNSFKNIISNIDYFYVAAEAPMVMSRIKSAVRLISLVAASGFPPVDFPFDEVVQDNLNILEKDYFPLIYRVHSTESKGYYTVHPIYNGVIDEIKDIDYYKAMLKIYRKSQKVLDGMNRTSILTTSYLYDHDIRFFSSNTKGRFGNLFLDSLDITKENVYSVVNKHESTFYVITIIIFAYIIYNVIGIIIPNTNKNYHFITNMVSLYKTLPSKFFNDQSNDYMDQIQQICENYEVEDEGMEKKKKMGKNSSTKNIKKIFVFYCFIVTLLLLFPFLTVFFYKNECQSLTNFLINSTKRIYYMASINLYDMEILIKDRYYYREGEELAIMTELYETMIKLENDLKNGVYGGKSSSQYYIFDTLNNHPGCPRSKEECDARVFSDFYTKELSESPIDYQMVEYLNKLNDYINNPPIRNYDITDPVDLLNIIFDIAYSPYIQFFKMISDDISANIDKMNELGTEYLINEAHYYTKVTLIGHSICSLSILITFYIFVSRPIKKQLRVIDSLNNIIFSIPRTVYNTSPKLKNFIENGKIE